VYWYCLAGHLLCRGCFYGWDLAWGRLAFSFWKYRRTASGNRARIAGQVKLFFIVGFIALQDVIVVIDDHFEAIGLVDGLVAGVGNGSAAFFQFFPGIKFGKFHLDKRLPALGRLAAVVKRQNGACTLPGLVTDFSTPVLNSDFGITVSPGVFQADRGYDQIGLLFLSLVGGAGEFDQFLVVIVPAFRLGRFQDDAEGVGSLEGFFRLEAVVAVWALVKMQNLCFHRVKLGQAVFFPESEALFSVVEPVNADGGSFVKGIKRDGEIDMSNNILVTFAVALDADA